MSNIPELEKQYLDAKIAYYEGRQIMEDAEFDFIERILRESGSTVIEQVGSKRKDFDYDHPTSMLSLSKIQTEEGDNKKIEFNEWYTKRSNSILKSITNVVGPLMYSSAKFDGNAINLIYKAGKFYQALTRGDGKCGKNITDRLKAVVPDGMSSIGADDTLEVRCEVVISKSAFEDRYSSDSANPRNFVAGILGGDDFEEEVINDLTIVPLHYLLNGKNVRRTDYVSSFSSVTSFYVLEERPCTCSDYEEELKYWIETRDKFPYQMDGIVFSFYPEYREQLGANDHDPLWATAIKFIPEIAQSEIIGIEWNVGKTGELAPVVLLNPVQLAGTTVKRASGYNAGYISNKPIKIGSQVSICKRGDIIPAIQSILFTPDETDKAIKLPTHCPDCSEELTFDGIHLMCNNQFCSGRMSKVFASSLSVLNIKRVGGKTIAPFAKDFMSFSDVIVWMRTQGSSEEIERYGIKFGSKSHDIIIDAFKKVVSIPYHKVIQILGVDNVGKKLSVQIANEHAGVEYDYAKLEKALVTHMRSPEMTEYIKEVVKELENVGIRIDRPVKTDDENVIYVCLTGSPASAGYSTKSDFLEHHAGRLVETSLSDKKCKYLVTNDLSSTTSKMTTATKKGIKIVQYSYEF